FLYNICVLIKFGYGFKKSRCLKAISIFCCTSNICESSAYIYIVRSFRYKRLKEEEQFGL
ncbi:MAG: hypothetical protein RLZ12_387, partial [Bacillota bacterium]